MDVHIGLPDDETNQRVAEIVEISAESLQAEQKTNPTGVKFYLLTQNEHHRRVYETWPWMVISEVG